MASLTSIHSQTITGSRLISYERLNEFARLYSYSLTQDSVIDSQDRQLALKDSIITLKEGVIGEYESNVIPSFKQLQINNLETIKAQESIIKYKDAQISIQKTKKWSWGVIGVLLGAVLGVVVGI